MKHTPRILISSIAALSIPFIATLPQRAQAGTATWNQTAAGTYDWGTVANWDPNTTFPNAVTDVANINNNIAGAVIINLATGTAANRTVNDLNLGDSDGTHSFTIASGVAGSLLIFGGTNPTLDITGNAANTISAGIRADANVVFRSTSTAETTISAAMTNNGTVRNITFNNDINGVVTAPASLQGQFSLTAANTLGGATGTVSISDVRVRGTIAGAFGANAANSVTVSNAGQAYLTGGTHVNNLVLNSTGWVETVGNLGALRIENSTVSGTVALQQLTTIGVNANNTGTLSGVISGGFGITKVGGTATSGQGELLLSAANTFTGPVTINQGSIRASNAAALGTNATVTVNASPTAGGDGNRLALSGTITIGAGKTLTLNSNGTGDFRSMLINTANNNTWAGNIVAAGTGLTQVSAASGTTLTITGGVTSSGGAGTGSLFTRGTGTVIYSGVINLGADRVFSRTDDGIVIVNSTGNSWVRTLAANGQIQIGANNALANGEFTFGQNSATNGRLELNGFNQTVTRLNTFATSTGTNHILRNSNLTSASTLTFATPGATTDILATVNVFGTSGGLGTLNLVSNGAGRTEFNGGVVFADSWTVNSGTIAFGGTVNRLLPGTVTALAGATIDKTGTSTLGVTGIFNNAGATTVTAGTLALSNGTTGDITVADNATLATGLNGGAISASSLTFGTAGSTTFAPILATPATAARISATSLTTAGTAVTVIPQAGSFVTGTYRLLDYGSIGGNLEAGFALGPVGSYPHITATLDTIPGDGRVELIVSAADSLRWAGNVSGVWDVNNVSNFALASSPTTTSTFYSGDAVVFGDTEDVTAAASPVLNRILTGGAVNNGNLTFNNSAGDYSVANVLNGVGGVTKNGTSTTTLSGANTYTGTTTVTDGVLVLSGANTLAGPITVTGGTLRSGNADSLRGSPLVTISGAGTFDAAGIAPGTKIADLQVSGAGVGGNGAIINSGAAITNSNYASKITLLGDTSWGGTGRYDMVGSLFLGGAFTLTKVGTNEAWWGPVAGSTLGPVVVNGGVFGVQSAIAMTGADASITVNASGTLGLFGPSIVARPVTLDGGAISGRGGATTPLAGIVTLQAVDVAGLPANRLGSTGTNAFAVTGSLQGPGGFEKNDTGTVQIQSTGHTYAGNTLISAGTLNFSATGGLPTTTNLIINGGTFDPSNLTHTVASLSGTGGSINQGTAGTGKVVTTQSTATTFNGTVNRVNVTINNVAGSLTLGGTADNIAGNATVENGTLILAKGNTAPALQAVHAVATGGLTINGGTVQLAGTYDNITTPGTAINLAPVGFNVATYGDLIYNAVGVALNAGTFDLNGREEAINTLTNPAGAGGTVTNTSATPAKLYIGHQNGASTFGGAINDGAGTVAIEKIGTGALTLTGTSNFTGGLTQTAGTTVIPVGAVLGNTPITVAANAFSFDGNHGTGAIALNGTSSFLGAGTSGGILTAATGTTVRVGAATAGTTATTLTLGGLNLSGGANLNLDFNATSTTVDKIATTVANGVTLNGANNVNIVLSGTGWVTGTYPVITYNVAGAVGGTGAAALALTTPIGHNTINFEDDLGGNINLKVTATANKWVGGNGTPWDTATTLNWNAGDQLFFAGDTAVFDDSATTFTPNIAANQTPTGVTFDNTVAKPYTVTSAGAFGIAGTAGLLKKNDGTVTISSANTYTGTTDVQEGTLIANYNTGTAQTVFAASSVINVAAGATFKAVANDSNFTLANSLTGSGLVVIDPHLTAAAGVRDVVISGNNAGFTGTLRLSPTVIGDGSGTFRTNAALTPAGAGGATIDVDAGGQAWLSAATFTNNFLITGHGYMEAATPTAPAAGSGLTAYTNATTKSGIGAIRMSGGTVISGNVTLDGSAKITPYNAIGTISGSIGVTNSADILSVGGINTGTSTLILTGTNNVGATPLNTVFVNAGGTAGTNVLQIGNLGPTGTLGTGQVTLYNDGAGAMLRVQRSDGYTLAQNVIAAHNGTPANLTKASFVANTQGTGVSVGGNTIDLTDGTGTIANAGNVFVAGHGGTNGVNNAIFNIDLSSIVKTGNFFVGDQSGFTGTVNQSGTSNVSVAGRLQIGHYPNNTSVYNMTAGTLATTANPGLVTNPAANTEQAGGIYLGIDGTGVMNQSDGTVTTDWVVLDNRGNTAAGTNMPDGVDRYNLSGGTLEIRGAFGITNRNGTTEFSFTGGTIKNVGSAVNVAISAQNNGATGNGTFVIGTGGIGTPTIDTNGATNQITISRDLTGAGALIKTGLGTLNLNVASPAWSGNFDVTGGIVATGAINGGLGSFTTAGRTISASGGSTISMTTNNVFGNGVGNANMPSISLDGATLSSTRYNAIGNLTLNSGAVLTQAATDGPGAYEGYQFTGTVTVGGSSASSITTTNARANHLNTNTVFTVAETNIPATTDLLVSAPLKDPSADFAGTGGLTKSGAGKMELTAVNTYAGGTTIDGGILNVNADAALGAAVGAVALSNNAVLQASGTVTTAARTLTLGAGGGTIDTNGQRVNLNAGSTVTGTTLNKIGLGVLTLAGTQTYSTLNVDAGGVNLDSALGTGTSTLDVDGTVNISGNQTLASLVIGAGGVVTLGGPALAPEGAAFAGGDPGVAAGFEGGAFDQPVDALTGGAATAAVPEPGSVALLMAGALGFLGRRRRKA